MSPAQPSRRRTLKAALGLGLACACATPAFGQSLGQLFGLRFNQNPFALGVASGFPEPNGIALWTRLIGIKDDVDVPVRCEIALDEAFSKGLQRLDAVALASQGHSVHLWPQRLAPQTPYFYRFLAGDAQSAVGRTRTAPALDASPAKLRLGLTSCQHFEAGTFKAWREIAQLDLDCVAFVGDYIYESNYAKALRIRDHNAASVPRTLDGYRTRYELYKSDADLQAAHAAHPWVLMWDDHEVENDYAALASARLIDAPTFAAQRASAYQAYWEHQPMPKALKHWPGQDAAAQMALNQRIRWGQLATLWTLDTRQHRHVHACQQPPGGEGKGGGKLVTASSCPELFDPSRSLLGMAQERWLSDGMQASKSTWRLLAQPTQISTTTPNFAAVGGEAKAWTDAWDGYPAARERLLRTIQHGQLNNVVTLGGDVHRHVAADLRLKPNDSASPIIASEFVTTSITSRGLNDALMAAVQANSPDMRHARSDERGYGLITVTPSTTRCDFVGTPHPVRDSSVFRIQASFEVELGTPGVKPAA